MMRTMSSFSNPPRTSVMPMGRPRFQQKVDARTLQAHLFDGLVQDQADCDIKRALIRKEKKDS